ncbi:hypothetical protein FACS189479_07060 [Spirochaetia bacterium]|nr:hypothetical protein FACS189479_07060 [Spirochaetia bacterium]
MIHKENGGLSDARNVGIRAAFGEYIVLLDSDDLFADNETLGNLCAVIEKTKAKMIFNSNLTTFSEDSYKSYDSIGKDFVSGDPLAFYKYVMRKKKVVLAGCFVVCLRSFLIDNNLFFKKGIIHEDELWITQLFCAAKQIAVNHAPFYLYRRERAGSITADIGPKNLFDRVIIIKEIQSLIKDDTYSKENKKIMKWRLAQLWYGTFSLIAFLRNGYRNDYLKVIDELNKLKLVLLGGRNIKYKMFFLFAPLLLAIAKLK